MSCRILIVEDEAIIAEDLKETISVLGHIVVGSIDNGLGALALARTLHPEIIFMDIHLRGRLDGIETAFLIERIMKKAPAFIFASAYPLKSHRLTQFLGKNIWIHKPYTAAEIEEAIKQSH